MQTHIEHLTINIGPESTLHQALARAFLRAGERIQTSAPADGAAPQHDAATCTAAPPRIGDAWPTGGTYVGIARGMDGAPDGHLVLLADQPEGRMPWQKAVDWAASLGDGARLPTRFESALLYANLRDQFDTGSYYWTGTQSSDADAWDQHFYFGSQYNDDKSFEARARAVRRFPA